MVKLNRNNTSYKELLDIIDTVGGYPVMAEDFDGTKLAISYKEGLDGKPYCVLWQPGDDRGSIKTNYYEDGRVEQAFVKPE